MTDYLVKLSELSEILGVRNPRAFARRHGLDLSVVKDLGTVIHSKDLPKWQAKASPKKYEAPAVRGARWFV
jgi:hypothetical protein